MDRNQKAAVIALIAVVILIIVCIIKRDKLIAFLDKIEMKDMEAKEETDG